MSSYLQVGLQAQTYGLPLNLVEEILLLPEITPIPDAPADVVGIVNRRGKTLPVIHLAKRLGIAEPLCQITDKLIVVNTGMAVVGVIVETVEDILETDYKSIEQLPELQPPLSTFLIGVAKLGEKALPLINPDTLIRSPLEVSRLSELDREIILGDFYARFAPTATAEDQEVFYQRKVNLSQIKQEATTDNLSIALAEIDREIMGFLIQQVKEFVLIDRPVPVPFSPDFVIGTVNLRSEILTLIDIRRLLDLPVTAEHKKQAIVAHSNKLNIGVAIDGIIGITEVSQASLSLGKEARQGIMGNVILGAQVVTIIDLMGILKQFQSVS